MVTLPPLGLPQSPSAFPHSARMAVPSLPSV